MALPRPARHSARSRVQPPVVDRPEEAHRLALGGEPLGVRGALTAQPRPLGPLAQLPVGGRRRAHDGLQEPLVGGHPGQHTGDGGGLLGDRRREQLPGPGQPPGQLVPPGQPLLRERRVSGHRTPIAQPGRERAGQPPLRRRPPGQRGGPLLQYDELRREPTGGAVPETLHQPPREPGGPHHERGQRLPLPGRRRGGRPDGGGPPGRCRGGGRGAGRDGVRGAGVGREGRGGGGVRGRRGGVRGRHRTFRRGFIRVPGAGPAGTPRSRHGPACAATAGPAPDASR